jgi:hypothetical protein
MPYHSPLPVTVDYVYQVGFHQITLLARLLYFVIIRITFSQHVMVSHTASPRDRARRRRGTYPSDVSRYLYCGHRLRFFVARHLAFTPSENWTYWNQPRYTEKALLDFHSRW